MPKKDFFQVAFQNAQQAAGLTPPKAPAKGRQVGGLKGGRARAKALTKKQRAEIAGIAATARWKKSGV